MRFTIEYLSFFVIQTEGSETDASKRYKHFKTLDNGDYDGSELKDFLDGEFARIAKRKAEVNAATDQAPTKIGRFIVEPGFEPESNPNYNLFQRLRTAEDKDEFLNHGDEMVRIYMETSAVRGGAFILAKAKLNKVTDDPFLFVLKCDFESKIARISDEKSLISRVEMAISARNIKSIQYPHMPEEGMFEFQELKIHQASHAKYFEDFLRFVTYEKSMPEIVSEHVMGLVQEYVESKWQPAVASATEEVPQWQHEEREQEAERFEIWAASEKRELQEKWTPALVMEATSRIAEVQPDLEMKFKLDSVQVRAKVTDYGNNIHIARFNGRYVLLVEGDSFEFEKGISPVELLHPEELEVVLEQIKSKPRDTATHRDDQEEDLPY